MKSSNYAEMLLKGQSGKDVTKQIIEDVESICSARVIMTRVRNSVLKSGDPRAFHPSHKKTIAKMKKAAANASPEAKKKFSRFEKGNLKYRYDAKRKYKKNLKFFEDKDLDSLLSELEMLPANMKTFVLPKEIAKKCADIAKQNLEVAHENIIIIEKTTEAIRKCIDYVTLCSESNKKGIALGSDKRLGVCLLLLSGRRTSEILNGKSVFTKGTKPTSVVFFGQLKKNEAGMEDVDMSYEIPLLCTSSVFIEGMKTLRNLQGNRTFTNKEVNAKYSTNLRYWTQKIFEISPNSKTEADIISPHDLRRIYVIAVYTMYNFAEQRMAINAVAKVILGHESLETSLNYLTIKLNGLTDEFPSEYRLNLKSGLKKAR